jgi:hypothetical protein
MFNFIADWSEYIFAQIGMQFARISSFMLYIKFEELFVTLEDLITPIVSIFASPIQFVKGYLDAAHEYQYPIMITVGSIVLIVLVFGLLYKYNNWFRNLMEKMWDMVAPKTRETVTLPSPKPSNSDDSSKMNPSKRNNLRMF